MPIPSTHPPVCPKCGKFVNDDGICVSCAFEFIKLPQFFPVNEMPEYDFDAIDGPDDMVCPKCFHGYQVEAGKGMERDWTCPFCGYDFSDITIA